MALACLSLGGNLKPDQTLPAAARELLARFPDAGFSPLYRSAAVGFAGPDFLNAAAVFDTDLDAQALVYLLHAIEHDLGRRRDGARFSSRPIDMDLLLLGDRVQSGTGLITLPRAELRDSAHVLRPLLDLCPELIDPQTGVALADYWRDLSPVELLRVELPDWPASLPLK